MTPKVAWSLRLVLGEPQLGVLVTPEASRRTSKLKRSRTRTRLISDAESPLDAGPREVAEVISKYNLLAVPVVDQHNRIQGIVTVDDVMERVMPARVAGRRRRIF